LDVSDEGAFQAQALGTEGTVRPLSVKVTLLLYIVRSTVPLLYYHTIITLTIMLDIILELDWNHSQPSIDELLNGRTLL